MAVRYEWLQPGQVPQAREGYEIVQVEPVRRRYRTVGYYLAAGERSTRYRPGQRVPTWYAERWPHKVKPVKRIVRVRWKIQERKRRLPAPEPMPTVPGEVFEVTIRYEGAKRNEDITVRMIPKTAQPRTVDDAKAAFWVAHLHGPDVLREWQLEAINWRGYKYDTSGELEDALAAMRGIIADVGWRGLRVARVLEGK